MKKLNSSETGKFNEELFEPTEVLRSQIEILTEKNRLLIQELNEARLAHLELEGLIIKAETELGLITWENLKEIYYEYPIIQQELNQIQNSTYWRLTKPLRVITNVLRNKVSNLLRQS